MYAFFSQTCRTFRGEVDSSIPRVFGGLWVIVFEAFRQTPENGTIETSPDKNTRVGSLRSPRECDGRLPPDAGYYPDLVIPRFEGASKKNRWSGEIIAWKNITNKVIDLHAIQSQNISKFTSNVSKHTSNLLVH